MRRLWLLLMTGILLAALAGCGRTSLLPEGQPYVTGTITEIKGGRILVEQNPGEQRGNKCWAAYSDKTVYLKQENGQVTRLQGATLAPGQQVSVWSGAPVLESYPCQGGADVILFQ